MPCSKFKAFTVPQLEAFVNARSQVIETIMGEMVEIQGVIAEKNKHYMEVERFEGMSPEQIADFHALAQGVKFTEPKAFRGA